MSFRDNLINYNDENVRLFNELHSGNFNARNKIIELNLGLVESIARHYSYMCNISYDDLYQEGVCALIKAVDNYDITRNVKFSSFAFSYIRGQICNYIKNNKYVVNISRQAKDMIYLYKKYNSEGLTKEQIADNMKISVEKLDEFINVYSDLLNSNISISLDDKVYAENDSNLLVKDLCVSPENTEVAIETVFNEQFNEELKKILPERQFQIISMRYGINCESMTQNEVAEYFNTSHQNIQRIENSVIKKLKNSYTIKAFNV
jgi:RNA polymerase sporulation-specific sigma factor